MKEEWRVIRKSRSSAHKQKWVRLRSGLWVPTGEFMLDAQVMPPIMGGSPGTVDKQTAATGDDGTRYTGSSGFSSTTSFTYWGYNIGTTRLHSHGFAFWGGVTIEGTIGANSYIECYAAYAGAGTPELKVYGVDESDPAAPTTKEEFDADPLTDAAVDWDGAWELDAWAKVYVAPIFQELVNSYAISNKRVGVQVKNDHGVTAVTENNNPRMWDYTGNLYGPKLHIEYTPTAAARTPRTPGYGRPSHLIF